MARKYSLEFISTFWRNISLSLEELVPVMVSKWELSFSGRWRSFCCDGFFFFFLFHLSHNDKMIIIKHVFITVWSISSLVRFCWRVLSDCAITWVPRTWYDLTPTGQRGKLYEKKSFTFDFHILPEHRRIDGKIFPWRCISMKTAIIHEVGVDPFTTVYLESKPCLNCWIAVQRAEITFISTHINANQNSYHDDKSIL